MIRVLFMIAIAGFVLSVASLSAAVALGGPDFVAKGGWRIAGDNDWDWGDRHDHDRSDRWGDDATRTLEWSDSDRLDLDLAADVRYVQADGPATVTITGPARLIDHVVVVGDTIKYQDRGHSTHRTKLDIVVRAPNISTFDISGSNNLTIEGYRQPKLNLNVSGSADITAAGETDQVSLDLSGSGDADLGGLKTKGAEVDISGSADATIAPTEWADLDISGRGDIRLLTRPGKLETDVSGSGEIHQSEGPAPGPPPPPTPPPAPSPKGAKT